MEQLSDDDLWRISRQVVDVKDQRRYRRLLKKSRLGPLTEREQQVLSELRATIDRVMLRRAYAYLLLKWRGHRVPSLSELESRV
jgi:hypothetical protein